MGKINSVTLNTILALFFHTLNTILAK